MEWWHWALVIVGGAWLLCGVANIILGYRMGCSVGEILVPAVGWGPIITYGLLRERKRQREREKPLRELRKILESRTGDD